MQLPPTSLVHFAEDPPTVPRVYDTPPVIVATPRAPGVRAVVARVLRRPSPAECAQPGGAPAAHQSVSR
jgi:hypothetical protein